MDEGFIDSVKYLIVRTKSGNYRIHGSPSNIVSPYLLYFKYNINKSVVDFLDMAKSVGFRIVENNNFGKFCWYNLEYESTLIDFALGQSTNKEKYGNDIWIFMLTDSSDMATNLRLMFGDKIW